MNAVAFYADSILWIYLVLAYERHGSVLAHKIRILIGQDFSCRCQICHPAAEHKP